MRQTFVQEALKQVGSPEILVNMVSRRVRQLGQGFRPMVEVNPRWSFMDVALREIADSKLTYEFVGDEATEESPSRKNRRRRS